jgi:cytochrome c peroxidase
MIRGALLLAWMGACAAPEPEETPQVDPTVLTRTDVLLLRQLWPLPAPPVDPTNAVADDPVAQHLGRFLFFDPNLSADGSVACSSCHRPDHGWAEPTRVSDTLAPTTLHAPSLVNVAYNRWHFWDGRCDTLWCQAVKPIENPIEMGHDRVSVAKYVAHDEALRAAFVDVFGDMPDLSDPERFPAPARPIPGDSTRAEHQAWLGMTPEDRALVDGVLARIGKVIAAYESQIVSRDAPFDTFARAVLVDGDPDGAGVYTDAERRGLKLFLGRGQCVACHAGPQFSNGEFHNVGLGPRDWLDPDWRGRVDGILAVRADPFSGRGLYSDDPVAGSLKIDRLAITREQDGQAKTPGLRDIALSPPYFHGGHVDTLEAVVDHYRNQEETPSFGHAEEMLVRVDLDEADVLDLVAFLQTLTGTPLSAELAAPPASPRLLP